MSGQAASPPGGVPGGSPGTISPVPGGAAAPPGPGGDPAGTPPAASPGPASPPPAAPAADGTVAPPSPGATPPAPDGPPLKLAPEDVPYRAFREVETERTRFKRELEALRREHEPLQEKLTAAERQIQEVNTRFEGAARAGDDLETLLAVLDRNPDLRTQVLDQLNAGGVLPRRAAAPSARLPGAAPTAPAVPTATDQRIDRVLSVIEQAEQRAATAEREAAQQSFENQVAGVAAKYLTERGYDPTQVVDPTQSLRLVDDVMDFLRQEGEALGGGRLADVPHLLNRWYARQEAIVNHRLRGYSADKRHDATLPPTVPGGTPAQVTERSLPISDPRFAQQAVELLRTRLAGVA